MQLNINNDDKYVIPEDRFDNDLYIESRVEKADVTHQAKLRSMLSYLYLSNGQVNIHKSFIGDIYLDEAEKVLMTWLINRTNGSQRKDFGSKALIQARKAKYRCEICGYADVRALNLHHVEGRVENPNFNCLCVNCHSIESRK